PHTLKSLSVAEVVSVVAREPSAAEALKRNSTPAATSSSLDVDEHDCSARAAAATHAAVYMLSLELRMCRNLDCFHIAWIGWGVLFFATSASSSCCRLKADVD
ncbi:hypothetical protein, partial [uncultured Muribaculum sp.]|uniref:hypothetical protein n=1 Tax=uncultured Muribaculum sp. TaxID=1918613 RepID=UPI0025B1080E